MHNSPRFPGTPGAHYEFRAAIGARNIEGLYGNATLIWLDRDGKGLSRTNLGDEGDRSTVASTMTDADGSVFLTASGQVQELGFAGTPGLRPAMARLAPGSE